MKYNKQQGKYDLDFTPVLWVCVVTGLVAGWVLAVAIPWLWGVLKPFLHQITG